MVRSVTRSWTYSPTSTTFSTLCHRSATWSFTWRISTQRSSCQEVDMQPWVSVAILFFFVFATVAGDHGYLQSTSNVKSNPSGAGKPSVMSNLVLNCVALQHSYKECWTDLAGSDPLHYEVQSWEGGRHLCHQTVLRNGGDSMKLGM